MIVTWKSRLQGIRNGVISRLDPELRRIWKICGDIRKNDVGRNAIAEDPLVQRVRNFPAAFKMSFWERHFEWNALRDYPEMQGLLLDFGCGSGHSDIFLARNGWQVHGVDISPFGIRVANFLRNNEPMEVQKRVSFQVADVTVCSPPREPYDSVWASHVFEHIFEPGRVIDGLRRWAKKDGCLLISVPLGHAYDDPTHVHHFDDAGDLRGLLENHICVLRTQMLHDYRVIRAVCKF